MPLMLVDVGLVIGTAILVVGIAHAIGKPSEQPMLHPAWNGYAPQSQFPPPGPLSPPTDPNNPYHPPQV
jgi:hypothetical protein